MPTPLESGTLPAKPAPVVKVTVGMERPTHLAMRQRTQRDYLDVGESQSVIRVVPLLRVFGVDGERRIAVGVVRIVVSAVREVAYEVDLHGMWAEGSTPGHFEPLRCAGPGDAAELAPEISALERVLAGGLNPFERDDAGNEYRAAFVAKALAEASRNAVAEIREVRYSLELVLAETSTRSSVQASQVSIVSALLQLGIICGRVADNAREAVREGLWVFLTDPEAYHSHRLLNDSTIISNAEPATALTRSWMRLHDAAVRQCGELCKQMEAELASVHALLAAAASVSSSREADAQTSFTTLAAVASLGLGIPALVLALYGADRILPLDTLPRQFAFLPVAAGLVFAAGLAVRRSPRGRRRWVWMVGAALMLVALLGLLVVAGLIAPTG